MNRLFCLCGLILSLSGILLAENQNVTKLNGKDILNASLAALNSLPPISMKIASSFENMESSRSDYKCHLFRENEKLDVSFKAYDINGSAEVKGREIWDGSMFIARKQSLTVKANPFYRMSFKPQNQQRLRTSVYMDAYANGIIEGDLQPAAEIMLNSKRINVSETMENIDGFSCYKIKAVTPKGNYECWIDPQNGFLPRRILVKRQGSDLVWGQPVGDRLVEFEMRALEIKNIDGHFIITKAKQEGKEVKDGKIIFSSKYNVSRSNIEWDPDFENIAAFTMDNITNGTIVVNMDTPGLRYVWQNGQPILDIGSDTIAQIDEIMGSSTKWAESSNTGSKLVNLKPVNIKKSIDQLDIEKEKQIAQNTSKKWNSRILLPICIIAGIFLSTILWKKLKGIMKNEKD